MTTKEELKKYFLNPFGNPYQRNTKKNFSDVLFPKTGKKDLLDILNNNEEIYQKQKEYIIKTKKKNDDKTDIREKPTKDDIKIDSKDSLREDEIKVNITHNEMNIDNANVDSKEHFDIKDKETNPGEQDENNISEIKYENKLEIENKENIINYSNKDKRSLTSNYTNVNIEESQSYMPGAIYNTEINNNREVHVYQQLKKPSSKLSSSTQDKYPKNIENENNNDNDNKNNSK